MNKRGIGVVGIVLIIVIIAVFLVMVIANLTNLTGEAVTVVKAQKACPNFLERIFYELRNFFGVGGGTQESQAPESSCTDSDGGINYDEQGTTCVRGVTVIEEGGTCLTDFCISNSTLREYYCANGTRQRIDYNCPFGCVDGECLPEGNGTEDYCTDSDVTIDYPDGKNWFEQGILEIFRDGTLDESYTDECNFDGRLIENWCIQNASGDPLRGWGYYLCGPQKNGVWTGCFDGACVLGNGTNQTLPDLIITNLTIDVQLVEGNGTGNETNETFYRATVFVTVKNIGDASTGTSFRTRIDVSSFSPRNIFTSALVPNQRITIIDVYSPIDEGSYNVTSFADILFQIDESNEGNNAFGPVFFTVGNP